MSYGTHGPGTELFLPPPALFTVRGLKRGMPKGMTDWRILTGERSSDSQVHPNGSRMRMVQDSYGFGMELFSHVVVARHVAYELVRMYTCQLAQVPGRRPQDCFGRQVHTNGSRMCMVQGSHGPSTKLSLAFRISRHCRGEHCLLSQALLAVFGPSKPQPSISQTQKVVVQRQEHVLGLTHLVDCSLH